MLAPHGLCDHFFLHLPYLPYLPLCAKYFIDAPATCTLHRWSRYFNIYYQYILIIHIYIFIPRLCGGTAFSAFLGCFITLPVPQYWRAFVPVLTCVCPAALICPFGISHQCLKPDFVSCLCNLALEVTGYYFVLLDFILPFWCFVRPSAETSGSFRDYCP